jgi:hypothetical protein
VRYPLVSLYFPKKERGAGKPRRREERETEKE